MSLHLGDEAPDFTAMTTDGEISFHEWKKGKWAVFFSHPADFTPVCTTELGRTAALESEFAKRNTKAMALSIDPVEEHHRWAPDIGEVTGTPLNFPIVADPDKRIAELYDMIHPGEGDTSTVRSVFIVDPDNKLRLMLTYPKSVGRNFDEIVRVIDALQATDANPIATPADWRPRRPRDRRHGCLHRGRQEAIPERRGGQALPPLRRRPLTQPVPADERIGCRHRPMIPTDARRHPRDDKPMTSGRFEPLDLG